MEEEKNKYKHPHFVALVTIIISLVIFTMVTQSCATTAQLYVDPRYKIQPDRSYPELQIGMKINLGPKITFKKKGEINSPIN